MAMRSRASTSVVMFDVVYQDGTRNSNRKVPAGALGGLDGDEPARGLIEAQDQAISEASGRPQGAIKSIARSPFKAAGDYQVSGRKARAGTR